MWQDNIRRVTPYTPGEQPRDVTRLIKLNTNEAFYPPAPEVLDALKNLAEEEGGTLRLYPDPDAADLTGAIAKAYGVKEEQVFTGVGSDEVLALSFLAFFNSGKPVLFPDITYLFYDVWAELYGIPYKTVRLDDNFIIHTEDYKQENGGIVIANPNAPTGVLKDLAFIEDLLEYNKDSVVIIDEAYIDYAGEGTSALPLIDRYDNLLVVRTTSKSRALAGMRIGYAFGSPELIGYLRDIKFSFNSYTMSRAALAAGTAAFSKEADSYYTAKVAEVMSLRRELIRELDTMGFSYTDSAANFVFVKHDSIPGRDIAGKLKERGIYVRRFDIPRVEDHLRVTVGSREETAAFLEALKEIIN